MNTIHKIKDDLEHVPTQEQWVIDQANKGLAKVKAGQDTESEGWLMYGEALNVGRAMFLGDLEFGRWVADSQLASASYDERSAAMWAADNLEQYKFLVKRFPNVRTVRGIHAKHKAIEAKEEKQKQHERSKLPALPDELIERVDKLKAQIADTNNNQNIVDACQSKLDTLATKYSFDTALPEETKDLTHDEMIEELIKTAFETKNIRSAKATMRVGLMVGFKNDTKGLTYIFNTMMRSMTK